VTDLRQLALLSPPLPPPKLLLFFLAELPSEMEVLLPEGSCLFLVYRVTASSGILGPGPKYCFFSILHTLFFLLFTCFVVRLQAS